MKKPSVILLSALALAASALVSTAQDANNNNGGRGGRGNFNPEEFRQRMNDRLKASLKVSDAEWGVLQPLIEKVTTKQREAAGSRFGGRGFGGPRGGDQGGATGGTASTTGGDRGQNRGGSQESQALRTTLENESASPEEIKSKLTAVRESRKKSQAEVDQAREELRKVLTVRQEAVLVSMGILE